MTEQDNIATIRGLYEDFGRGDLRAILARVADDVVWVDPGPPEVTHAGTYHGREGVTRFFTALAETVDFEGFEPREFFATGDRVVVLGWIRARVRATGGLHEDEWAMAFTLRDGAVTSFRVYEDTASELRAHTAAVAAIR